MSAVGALQLILLAGLTFSFIAGLAASWGVPPALAYTDAWSPERRHRALLLVSVSPSLLALSFLLAVLSRSLLAFIWPEYDHCLVHDDHHVHLCLVHLPQGLGSGWSWLISALAMLWLSARASLASVMLYRASRCAARLSAQGAAALGPGARVLATELPLCLLVGVVRPTIFVSTGLLQHMTEQEVGVLIHHERAHATRHDILLRLVAQAFTVFMRPSARSRLLVALELAAEQSCDEVAAKRAGDRLHVAETILKVERLLQGMASKVAPLAASFGGQAVPLRVAALLEAPRAAGSLLGPVACLALAVLAVLAASEPLHHQTESLLGALTR